MKQRMFRLTLSAIAIISVAGLGTAWAVMSSGPWTPYSVSEGDWDDLSIPDSELDVYTLKRVVTTVQRIVVQRRPLGPTYAVSLAVDMPTDAGAGCTDNTIAYITPRGWRSVELPRRGSGVANARYGQAGVGDRQVGCGGGHPDVPASSASGCTRPLITRSPFWVGSGVPKGLGLSDERVRRPVVRHWR